MSEDQTVDARLEAIESVLAYMERELRLLCVVVGEVASHFRLPESVFRKRLVEAGLEVAADGDTNAPEGSKEETKNE